MKWFFKWIKSGVTNLEDDEPHCESPYSTRLDNNIGSRQNTLNFCIHVANGGYVLEYNTYDERKDEIERRLYIIGDGEDLGQSLSKTITMELLRK